MLKNYILNGLNLDKYQLNLLNWQHNSLVIAGAGTGKTFAIIAKIKYLIEQNKIPESKILLISFTNCSVNDLKNKLNYNVTIYTFHKLAMMILDKNNINYHICNSQKLNYIIKEYLFTCEKYEQKIILKYLKINMPFKIFLNSKYCYSFINLIESFLNIYKTNNLNKENILNINYCKIEKKILLIIFKIYKIYLEEKNSNNTMDFDDLILNATKLVKNTILNFQYIIIDEFQDTSYLRLNLIKEISLLTHAKIIVVGDDWQSIYHFSGCDLNIFLNFPKIFTNVKIIKFKYTYRNSQELIDIASTFILKNKQQITKDLISSKHITNPIIFTPYQNPKKTFKKLLNKLLNINKEILILGRNNKDIYYYLNSDMIYENNKILYQNHYFKYLTVHKSKGLEANIVIILNCNNNKLGFPNQIENSNLINKLFIKDKIKYSEERRLFYVAITRCQQQTFLLYDKYNPSSFIKEIKKITKKKLKHLQYFK